MGQDDRVPMIPQYSVIRTLGVWAAAADCMGVLGWIVAPMLAADPTKRVRYLIVGC